MDRLDALLTALADGQPHSGEALGERLGVTRAAIWKLARQLRDQGVAVTSAAGRGYQLAEPLELLDARRISARLGVVARELVPSIEVRRTVPSTNAILFDAVSELTAPRALLAEAQSAGRGRRGRPWHSPFGRNLYLSLAWPFTDLPGGIAGLSLAAGLAVARCLRGYGVAETCVKWPNDLQIHGHKVGGLLVEFQGEPAGPCAAVVGLGLNLDMPDAPGVDQPWTALRRHLPDGPGRNAIAGDLIDALANALVGFQQQGAGASLADWSAFDALAGREVTLHFGDRRVEGRACGIDASGCLLVDAGQGPTPWSGGEVSVRARS